MIKIHKAVLKKFNKRLRTFKIQIRQENLKKQLDEKKRQAAII